MSSSTFALKPEETLERGIRRLLEQFEAEARRLGRPAARRRSGAVHDARVLIKRLRALVWLIRPVLGTTAGTEAKEHLRDAARLLSQSRDAAVARTTLAELIRQTMDDDDLRALTMAARSLRKEENALPEAPLIQAMERVCAALVPVRKQTAALAEWPLVSVRLEKALRQFRLAGKRARRTEKATAFHEWRKKSKRLLYLLEMVRLRLAKDGSDFIQRLDGLQETLGDGHDCVISRQALRRRPTEAAQRSVRLLRRREKRLEGKAQKRARRLGYLS